MQPITGLQLYSVREAIKQRTYAEVIKEVAAIGFAAVEPAGFPGTTAAEAGKLFRDLGLKVVSGHFAIPVGEHKNQVLDDAAAIGCRRIVSGHGPDAFKTPDAIRKTCDLFNEAAEEAGRRGMTFGIHNHWWEFEKMEDGQLPFDHMLSCLRPDVFFEIDVYWVRTAGADPAAIVRKAGLRAPLLHIKDGPCVKGQPMTAAGTGTVDIPAVAEASAGTAEAWIVELDNCATDMMEAVRQSHRYITGRGFAKGRA